MTIQEAMAARHSVRQYEDRPLEDKVVEALEQMVAQCNRESGLHIQLICDEPLAFESAMAHYGNFVNVRNYLALIGPKGPKLDETCGYYGEMLVLAAQRLGLNSCWVGLTFRKQPDRLEIAKGEKLALVIALGYGANQGKEHLSKTPVQVSDGWQNAPDWFKNGVNAALLAPTAVNQQKFRFRLGEDGTVSAQAGLGFFSKVDLGIAKYHFEIGAGKDSFRWA